MTRKSVDIYKIVLIIFLIALTLALATMLLMGTTSRYMQDDYCYGAILRGDFWQRQVNAYLTETTFSGNRFSLTFFIGIDELFGPGFISFVPPLTLLAWLACLYFFARQIPGLDRKERFNYLEALTIAEALEVLTLAMAPNWVQVYFWRAGMLPYLAPLVTGTLLMGLLARIIKRGGGAWPWTGAVFLTAFFTAGFSEIAVMVELAMLLLGFFSLLLVKRWQKQIVIPFAFAVAGCLAGLALILFSPMNQLRMQRSYSEYAPLMQTIINSFQGGVTFYLATLYRSTLYFISALLIFALFGWALSGRLELAALPIRKTLLWSLLLVIAAYLVTAAAMIPGFYAESSYPSDRALIVPRFVSLLLALGLGLLAGNAFSSVKSKWLSRLLQGLAVVAVILVDAFWLIGMKVQFHPPAFPETRTWVQENPGLALLVLTGSALLAFLLSLRGRIRLTLSVSILLVSLPVFLTAARFLDEYPLMHERAVLWDGRDEQIRQMAKTGQTELVVPAMNSLAGILELSDDPGFWVNNCAAAFYRVGSISAVEPVLDPVQLSNP